MSYKGCEKKLEVFDGNIREYIISYNSSHLVIGCGNKEVKVNHGGFELLFIMKYKYSQLAACNHYTQHQFECQKVALKECPKNLIVNFRITNNCWSRAITFTSDCLKPSFSSNLAFHTISNFAYNIIIEVYDIENERAQTMADDMDELFKNGQSSDVILVVGEEEIKAHKLILSTRSEVFAKMFESDMLEKQNGRVEITDIDADTFKLLLRFIYCSQLDTYEAEELLKLIVAADKYCVKSLISTCGYRVLKKISIENAIEVLLTADAFKLDFLKKICMNFIIKNKKEIVDTEDFERVKGRCDLLYELFVAV